MEITLYTDLDNTNLRQAAIVINQQKKILKGYLRKIEYRTSSSGKGLHLKYSFWFPEEYKLIDLFSFKIGLRLMLKDDIGRIKVDLLRKDSEQKTDRLFKVKNGKVCQNWKLFYKYQKKNERNIN